MTNYRAIALLILTIGVLVLAVGTNNLSARIDAQAVVIERQSEQIETYKTEIDGLNARIDAIQPDNPTMVTVTCYTASADECDSTPNITAINRPAIPGRTVALSRDLLHNLGKRVYIEGLGVLSADRVKNGETEFVAEDLMNARYKHRIDVLVRTKAEAYAFGVQQRRVAFYE